MRPRISIGGSVRRSTLPPGQQQLHDALRNLSPDIGINIQGMSVSLAAGLTLSSFLSLPKKSHSRDQCVNVSMCVGASRSIYLSLVSCLFLSAKSLIHSLSFSPFLSYCPLQFPVPFCHLTHSLSFSPSLSSYCPLLSPVPFLLCLSSPVYLVSCMPISWL